MCRCNYLKKGPLNRIPLDHSLQTLKRKESDFLVSALQFTNVIGLLKVILSFSWMFWVHVFLTNLKIFLLRVEILQRGSRSKLTMIIRYWCMEKRKTDCEQMQKHQNAQAKYMEILIRAREPFCC